MSQSFNTNNSEILKILLFGGTFDPIHRAHVQLAETMRKQSGADEVWFMITPQNPWKTEKQLTDDQHRLAMARLALEVYDHLVASDYEFRLDKPTYTYKTLRHLREEYPEHEFMLLVGGDNWDKFDQWAEHEEILQHHQVVVYPRAEGSDLPYLPISSTEIRQRISEGKDTSDMIDSKVADYIKEHNLYKNPKAKKNPLPFGDAGWGFMYLLSIVAARCTVVESALQKLYSGAWAEIFFVLTIVWLLISILPRIARCIVRGIIYAVMYPVALADVYCYVKFDAPLNPSILMLMGESDTREMGEFFSTYLSPDIITTYVGWILLIMLAHIAWTIHRCVKRPKKLWQWEEKVQSIIGKRSLVLRGVLVSLFVYCGIASWDNISGFWQLLQMDNIGDVEHRLTEKDCPVQFHPLQRLAFSIRANQLTARQIDVLHRVSEDVKVDSCSYTSPEIVLIIGEAYCKSHSQLYGYERPTTPRQLALQQEGSLVAYDDVVSPWNLTSYVFKHLMTTYAVGDKGSWCDYPLFPQLFRQAGYHVTFLTNEFVTQAKQQVYDFSGGFFLNDPELSKRQFDERNKKLHVFDEDLIHDYMGIREERRLRGDTLQKGNLTIFHLIGQHFDYRIRCPRSKMHFTPADYSDREDLNSKWKRNLCYYDNATLYNDSVVYEITRLFADRDAIVIYMPDHGEEVHSRELPHFAGRMHSTAITSRLARYEFQIPFWIWGSDRYRRNHPEIWNEVRSAANRPYMTDALSHLLLYLSGIHCQYYREDLNLLSPQYNAKRPRIIKHQADYDQIVNQ